jgi:hypothetical protein
VASYCKYGETLVLIKCAVYWLAEEQLASQDGLLSMELSGQSVSQLATYHKIFSSFFLVLLKKACSYVHGDAARLSINSLCHFKITQHVSGAFYTHHQEYQKLVVDR